MARLIAEIINGQRVVSVETEEEFFHYLGKVPMECPPGMAERFGFTDEISPEELEEELKDEREWEELQKQWAEEDRRVEQGPDASRPFSQRVASPSSVVVIRFPYRRPDGPHKRRR